jgi:mono/diheme cytochrome c family protein
LLVPAAQADRAGELFSSRCAGCHTLGKGQAHAPHAGMLDLTLVGLGDQAHLRAQLANPRALDADAACGAQLDRAQIDALLILFRSRAQADQGVPAIPVAAYRNAAPTMRAVDRH